MKHKETKKLPDKANEGDIAVIENKSVGECIIFIWHNKIWVEYQRYKGTKLQLKRVLQRYNN